MRCIIYISGDVQGVGFRFSARMNADALGLKNIVADNLEDGRVYIEAEGKKEDLEKLASWCRKGPMLAKVDGVEVEYGA